jgi:competence protein ComEA
VPDGPSRSQLLVYAAIAIAVVVLGARYLRSPGSASSGAAAPAPALRSEEPQAGGVVVHVAGAVRQPGVYRLRAGARVDDALQRAGGPTRRADLGAVNLAAKAEDGRQVLVPEKVRAAAGATGAAAAPGVPLNLNTATLEQLDALTGIGPTLAQQILDFREANGGFGSIDELADVPGIGDARLASLREQVRV